jgi:cell wall-associated NlpC family hydrolase
MGGGSARRKSWAVVALALGFLAGCATTQPPASEQRHISASAGTGPLVVAAARDLLGVPYRLGGEGLRGVDCSGLVYYAYARVGVAVPRTAQELYQSAWPVSLSDLHQGDLLFFRTHGRAISHVGIYGGDDRFIHAGSATGRVTYASLSQPYWRKRLVGAGRFF